MKQKLNIKWIDISILVLSMFLATLRGTIFWTPFWKTTPLFTPGWTISILWGLVAILIISRFKKSNQWNEFARLWKKEKILLIFLSFSFLSIFWSISFADSSYRFSILLFSSLAGSYIGFRYGIRRLVDILFWFAAVIIILSLAFRFVLPDMSIHYGHPYFGAWHGIYWHRNSLGAMSAFFSTLFLLHGFTNFRQDSKIFLLDILFYIFSLALVYFAKSAAGYMIVVALHILVIAIAIWLSLRSRLITTHYYILAVSSAISAFAVITNLDFVFGLFNREASLTGRVPMWEILIEKVFLRSPWIGYGYGAIWANETFRLGIKKTAKWSIFISDNGFIDILLHIGLIGLTLFLCVWGLAWIRSFQYGFKRGRLLDFFPLIFMTFTLLGNVSFSFFLEVESFVWMIIIALLFAISRKQPEIEGILET